jgi:hypothetical protein
VEKEMGGPTAKYNSQASTADCTAEC